MPKAETARGTGTASLASHPALERRLRQNMAGEVRFDLFTRGRYATDASIYQIIPAGVVFPKTIDDVRAAIEAAAEHGVPVIARGGGTSQNGQPIGHGLIIDFSRHLGRTLAYDKERRTVTVEPGMVLETLNTRLRADGLFFPVEPSTASRCTIGGMAGNNSCGARSLRYGRMAENVLAIDALDATGAPFRLGRDAGAHVSAERNSEISRRILSIADRERDEIAARFPTVQRRVGGYNLDALVGSDPNLSSILVGSEGTLGISTALTLTLSPLPAHRVLGICHFPSFRSAMETTQHLVALGPVAVELVDNNVLVLGRDIPLFQRTLARITKGTPNCLLIVEFAGHDLDALGKDLARLDQCMADHGFPDAVVEVREPSAQKQVWEVREACLNIMMSMKGDAKPVSFIEDCAVPLEHLADYTERVTEIFAKHGTRGTWYAHASVGCLHVRPILDMKSAGGVKAMREIAEEVCSEVRRFKGSYSGEHGDGISRSEFIAPIFGERLVRAFEDVKREFDPAGRLNPGKIVAPYRFDDRALMRFKPEYRVAEPVVPVLDWSAAGGFGAAVEMCNNNGTCRKLAGGGMCPSYRATRDETHVTRGRANALRLAISGQLGPDAFTSPDMKTAMDLCVGCKSCRRECPTGVDMARMKIEFLHNWQARHGLTLKDRLVAYLPRYAPYAARLRGLLNLRDVVPGAAWASEALAGFSARRTMPHWSKPWSAGSGEARAVDVKGDGRDLVLFADTFNRYFEPGNLSAARRVLEAAGYRLHHAGARDGGRPLCCGRTFLSAGMVDDARQEARRSIAVLAPLVAAGARVVGLEPSCLLTFRDEISALSLGAEAAQVGAATFLVEEVLDADLAQGRVTVPLRDQGGRVAHIHGHCHQKAHDAFAPAERLLRRVPGLDVKVIESSCCGMAGAFGFDAQHYDVSVAMAELALFPAVRKAAGNDLVVANGTSCRHQISDGLGREAVHIVQALDAAL